MSAKHSKLLLDESPIVINGQLAALIGLEESMFVDFLWSKTLTDQKPEILMSDWQAKFLWMDKADVEQVLQALVESGLVSRNGDVYQLHAENVAELLKKGVKNG